MVPGVSVASGLGRLYASSGSLSHALQEMDEELDLTLTPPPLLPPGGLKAEKTAGGGGGGSEDEELTNLNWLHESKNLLNSFGDPVLRSVSPVQDLDEDTPPSPAQSDLAYDAKQNPKLQATLLLQLPDLHGHRGRAGQAPARQGYLHWIPRALPLLRQRPHRLEELRPAQPVPQQVFQEGDKDRSQIRRRKTKCIAKVSDRGV
ncbi:hypothetical protein ACEWY4_027714 [Coilia grayii]|uniref:Uncharacterized protein n=1 Tax=Coilia grayii TaxID=363190 RepID=A0ABD1IPY9_9TELE